MISEQFKPSGLGQQQFRGVPVPQTVESKPPSAVATAVARCVDLIATVKTKIGTIEGQLTPILQLPIPDKQQPTDQKFEQTSGVPFADYVNAMGDDLDFILHRLRNISDRISI